MNLRKLTFLVLVPSLLALSSCGAMRRLGKDVVIGAGTIIPVVPLYGGATDGMAAATGAREGYGGGAFTEVVTIPFTFTYNFLKHAVYGCAHILDIPLFVVYGPADLNPYAPDIEPLHYYDMPLFDGKDADHGESGTDADSGEKIEADSATAPETAGATR